MKSLSSRKLALCLFPTQWRGTSDLFWLVSPHDMTELLFIKIPGLTPREFLHCKDAVLDGYMLGLTSVENVLDCPLLRVAESSEKWLPFHPQAAANYVT